jgi:hypothetical protein
LLGGSKMGSKVVRATHTHRRDSNSRDSGAAE